MAKWYGVDPDVVEYEWTNVAFMERMYFMLDYLAEEERQRKEAAKEAKSAGKPKGQGVTWRV